MPLRTKGKLEQLSLCEKCQYSEFFWSVFSRIQTEYEEIRSISPYSVQMRENKDQNNSEHGYFSHSDGSNYPFWLKSQNLNQKPYE